MDIGIYDVPSSLTFEPGNLYMYSRIGREDAIQNINLFNSFIQKKNFDQYLTIDDKILQPQQQLNLKAYSFNGREYASIDVSKFDTTYNIFTLSFWASRKDWSVPCGFELAGNFTDYGIGIFNYEFVNPLLMYISSNSIYAYNSNLDLINKYDLGSSRYGNIVGVSRRDPLNSFHIFTSLSSVYELNLQEAIIDSAQLPGQPTQVVNDKTNSYIAFNNSNSIGKLNLLTNTCILTTATYLNVSSSRSPSLFNIITYNNRVYTLSTYNNTLPVLIKNNIYFLNQRKSGDNGGVLSVWEINSGTFTASAVIDSSKLYQVFNIDTDNRIWCVSGLNIDIYGQYGVLNKTITLNSLASSYKSLFTVQNIAFAKNFVNGRLEESIFVSSSGASNIFVSKIDKNGNILKTITIPATAYVNYDPSNYNYSQANVSQENNYTFKARMFNLLNTEDSSILSLSISGNDLNPGYHHFAITVDALKGEAIVYLDGSFYNKQLFEPGTYAFTSTVYDNLIIGATPFYNGTLLDTFLSKDKGTQYYTIKDLSVQNFYWFNKVLDYFDINMLFKEKIEPNLLLWDVPCGRRFYIDTVSRYFTNRVPGAKSGLINLYINTDVLDQQCRDALEPEIISQITSTLPSYVKLNKLVWASNFVQLSGGVNQPSYIGNIVTNAQISR